MGGRIGSSTARRAGLLSFEAATIPREGYFTKSSLVRASCNLDDLSPGLGHRLYEPTLPARHRRRLDAEVLGKLALGQAK
jgi:hypothetical protein